MAGKRSFIVGALVMFGLGVAGGTGGTAWAKAPYEWYAVYDTAEGDKPLRLPLKDGQLIIDQGDHKKLQKIVLVFPKEGFTSTTLDVFHQFTSAVYELGKNNDRATGRTIYRPAIVDADDAAKGAEVIILPWSDTFYTDSRKFDLKVNVWARFDSKFLCSQERYLQGEATVAPKLVGKGTFCEVPQAGQPTQGSKPAQGGGGFKEEKPAQGTGNTKGANAATASQANNAKLPTKELVDLLNEKAHLRVFGDRGGDSIKCLNTKGKPCEDNDDVKSVYLEEELTFSILRTGNLFSVREEERGGNRNYVSQLVDQASRISLEVTATEGGACHDVSRSPFNYYLDDLSDDTKDAKERTRVLKLDFRETCRSVLDVEFKNYLDKRLRIRVGFRLTPEEEITVFRTETFQVVNLGLITTFPVVTEIAAAVTKPSLKDIESASSVPISVAVGLTNSAANAGFAVTFPWKLSYNSRRAPDFAKFFSVYAHLSVLASSVTSRTIVPIYGVGVSLAQVFHISWAIDPGDSNVGRAAAHYLLIGFAPQDIIRAIMAR
ncbi:MAG TPA: hypothetical protein VH877_02130 [Polyangia bacterium]|nr:hypothetical protein [Polyangia bacterium]